MNSRTIDSRDEEQRQLAEARQLLCQDMDQLREREENLRLYEMLLWARQGDRLVSAGAAPVRASLAPFFETRTESAWQKFNRAQEILEAEARNLRDDRQAMEELGRQLKQRLDLVAQREVELATREDVATAHADAADAPHSRSPLARLFRKAAPVS